MMSADDDPQIPPLKTVPSKNNLISEAFNLNSNLGGIQPWTVLPPSTNHFQPISHSRTPSTEIKDLKLSALKPPPPNPFQNAQSKTPNSFFDQPTITPNALVPPAASVPLTRTPEPSELFKSGPAASAQYAKPPSVTNISPMPTMPTSTSIQPPTSSIQPPTGIPPPPSSTSSGSANPYAAKGALNKKVYNNNIINVAQTTAPVDFLNTPPPSSQLPSSADNFNPPSGINHSQSANNLFMPPPTTVSATTPLQPPQFTPATMPTMPTMPTSQSYHQFPTQTPNMSVQPNVNNQQYNNSNVNSNSSSTSQNGQNGMWNWFAQNKLVNTFVEKAKIGVESFVTTVDPQMSNYNHPANRPLYLLSTITTPKVGHTIREAFNNVGFSKISLNSIDAQNSSQFAAQIIGYPCAIQSAREKIENSLAMMQDAECTVIALQDFMAELTTDCWFELAVIMLKDKRKNIELTVFTEAVPISSDDMSQLEQYTPNDYNLKWSGLACRLPEKNFNFNAVNPNCQSPFLSYDTTDTLISNARLSHALQTMATLFKNRMLAQMS